MENYRCPWGSSASTRRTTSNHVFLIFCLPHVKRCVSAYLWKRWWTRQPPKRVKITTVNNVLFSFDCLYEQLRLTADFAIYPKTSKFQLTHSHPPRDHARLAPADCKKLLYQWDPLHVHSDHLPISARTTTQHRIGNCSCTTTPTSAFFMSKFFHSRCRIKHVCFVFVKTVRFCSGLLVKVPTPSNWSCP